MDTTRHSARRVGPHKEAEFSSQSIMKSMERFVDAVQDMEQTILVPSRLMDLKIGDESDTITVDSKPKDMSTDLYRLYTMVNCVKNELLWANNIPLPEDDPTTTQIPHGASHQLMTQESCSSSSSSSPSSAVMVKGHVRRPSTTSVASSQSVSGMSDTDSEASNENDSGIEGETESRPDFVSTAETTFRRHLHGLQRSLAQMTTAADYLTKRYQNDIGATV